MSLTCVEQEQQCVLHWFQSWSMMQKADFHKDLVEKAVPDKVSTLFDAMNAMNMADKPPSIFKCQMKLFDQWFSGWTDKQRNEFLIKLETLDQNFVAGLNAEIAATSGQA